MRRISMRYRKNRQDVTRWKIPDTYVPLDTRHRLTCTNAETKYQSNRYLADSWMLQPQIVPLLLGMLV